METLIDSSTASNIQENTIFGTPKMTNSKVIFKGKGNILYCEEGVHLVNSNITFNSNNAVVFLSKSRHGYLLNVSISNDSTFYVGRDNYFNGKMNAVISERKSVVIGNGCLISFECWLRTADAHAVYDAKTKKRINHSKSIFIGDHVWIGQHVYILKGTEIGSGSIIGGLSVVSGKKIESNTSNAGNPVKKIADSVFFTGNSVHLYSEEDTEKHDTFDSDEFIYKYDENEYIDFSSIENSLESSLAEKRVEYLLSTIQANQKKNRFFLSN